MTNDLRPMDIDAMNELKKRDPIAYQFAQEARRIWMHQQRSNDKKQLRNISEKKIKTELRRDGICVNCRRRPAKKGFARCPICMKILALSSKKKYCLQVGNMKKYFDTMAELNAYKGKIYKGK